MSCSSCKDTSQFFTRLQILGINIQDDNADSLAERLRQLVVDEWQGKFCDHYFEFFTPNENADSSEAFIKEAERYRKKGRFAGLLGDSMPLALANV